MGNHISGGVFFGTVIQGQRIQLTLPREITPALSGLPDRTPSFAGREEELARIVGELEDHPVVTIVGMPGVGKTELAVQAAWRAWKDEGRFPGGVLIIDLQGYNDRLRLPVERALTQLLGALGVPDDDHLPKDAQGLTRLYRSVLAAYAEQERRLLVVVDNTSGEEQARPLLPTGGYHAALVTSRHSLVLGEARTVLRPLPADAAVELVRRVLGEADGRSSGTASRPSGSPICAATCRSRCGSRRPCWPTSP